MRKSLETRRRGETTGEDAERLGLDFQSGGLTLHLQLVRLNL